MSDYQYIKGPKLSEKEMEQKLDDLRKNVGQKLNKWADRLQFSMHYTPKIERYEGERWTEGGKTWILQNGTKKSISVLQEARMPHWCPRCSMPMNHRFDRKFYYLRGHCFNCNVELEGEMRLNGTWEEFEKRTTRENEKAFLRDKIQEHMEYIRTFKEPQLHFSDGRWEKLATVEDFRGIFESLEKDIEFMLNRLEQIRKEEEEESNENST